MEAFERGGEGTPDRRQSFQRFGMGTLESRRCQKLKSKCNEGEKSETQANVVVNSCSTGGCFQRDGAGAGFRSQGSKS